MGSEIEAKLRYDRHEELVKVLRAAGAEFVAELVQRDLYLDDASGSMKTNDAALRIREEIRAGNPETAGVIITYKGPHESSQFKKRRENNLKVSSSHDAEELLAGLGYRRKMMIEKKRSLWRLDKCEVALDELPLIGRFVEIEGPDEATVNLVQKKLGLGSLPHIPQSYAALLEERQHRQDVK